MLAWLLSIFTPTALIAALLATLTAVYFAMGSMSEKAAGPRAAGRAPKQNKTDAQTAAKKPKKKKDAAASSATAGGTALRHRSQTASSSLKESDNEETPAARKSADAPVATLNPYASLLDSEDALVTPPVKPKKVKSKKPAAAVSPAPEATAKPVVEATKPVVLATESSKPTAPVLKGESAAVSAHEESDAGKKKKRKKKAKAADGQEVASIDAIKPASVLSPVALPTPVPEPVPVQATEIASYAVDIDPMAEESAMTQVMGKKQRKKKNKAAATTTEAGSASEAKFTTSSVDSIILVSKVASAERGGSDDATESDGRPLAAVATKALERSLLERDSALSTAARLEQEIQARDDEISSLAAEKSELLNEKSRLLAVITDADRSRHEWERRVRAVEEREEQLKYTNRVLFEQLSAAKEREREAAVQGNAQPAHSAPLGSVMMPSHHM